MNCAAGPPLQGHQFCVRVIREGRPDLGCWPAKLCPRDLPGDTGPTLHCTTVAVDTAGHQPLSPPSSSSGFCRQQSSFSKTQLADRGQHRPGFFRWSLTPLLRCCMHPLLQRGFWRGISEDSPEVTAKGTPREASVSQVGTLEVRKLNIQASSLVTRQDKCPTWSSFLGGLSSQAILTPPPLVTLRITSVQYD